MELLARLGSTATMMVRSWTSVTMLAVVLVLGVFGVAGAQNAQKHFLSAMVVDRNQSQFLQEFVRHYIEEGVDHVFIYDSLNSTHIHRELHCINSTYYTIVKPFYGSRAFSRARQQLYELIQPKTEWVIQVDVDDFISSRASPDQTIREVLQFGTHSMCPTIAVPTLNFAWGATKATPEGRIRSSLTYRWRYGSQHMQTNTTKREGSRGGGNSTASYAKNRVIFHTAQVESVRANTAVTAERASVCVPTTRERLSCAQSEFDRHQPAPKSGAELTAGSGNRTRAKEVGEEVEVPAVELPKYCPRQSLYRARRSASTVLLAEEDVRGLSLACHHYRYPSWEEWRRQYQDRDASRANRMDVSDDYMLRRAAARRDHPQQREAERAMAHCHRAVGTSGSLGSAGSAGTGNPTGRAGEQANETVGRGVTSLPPSPSLPSAGSDTEGGSQQIGPVQRPAPTPQQLQQGEEEGTGGRGTVFAELARALHRLLGWRR